MFLFGLQAGKDNRLDKVKSQPGTFLLYWTVQVRLLSLLNTSEQSLIVKILDMCSYIRCTITQTRSCWRYFLQLGNLVHSLLPGYSHPGDPLQAPHLLFEYSSECGCLVWWCRRCGCLWCPCPCSSSTPPLLPRSAPSRTWGRGSGHWASLSKQPLITRKIGRPLVLVTNGRDGDEPRKGLA
jgi:hypothetical protein